jgi:glycosyltransferase involved in cell wall biosynthesis
MEKERKKILFFNKDGAGVNYFRTQTPAIELERNHSNDFEVEINSNVNFNNIDEAVSYLKSFDIIHYHRQLFPDLKLLNKYRKELKDSGTLLIMDIDDYWFLDKTHPMYFSSIERGLHNFILANIEHADYITTTTELFASEIRKVTQKDNVVVLYNSVNPEWMEQFSDNRKESENGLIRINYMAGSSHKYDIQQLYGVVNVLDANLNTSDKFKIMVSGWDTKGNATDLVFNEEFGEDLKKLNLFNQKIVNKINANRGDLMNIEDIPYEIRAKYGNAFTKRERSITAQESVYLEYEKILTNNHKLIKDEKYLQWLMKFERGSYENEGNFARRWTQKANIYAEVLNETDVSLAPLVNNKFNMQKSNLKQVECWSRKIPVVCSDMPPYNVDGVHMKNCILIPTVKNAHKYWTKALKKIILEPNLREDLGNQLYEDFKDKYHLTNVTKTRAEFYNSILE